MTALPTTVSLCVSMKLLMTFVSTGALAASTDVNILWRLLAPADLALMVGNACLAQDSSFLTRTTGRHGDFRVYAQEVKDKVSEGLSEEDLLLVLRRAADAAKAEALSEVRNLNSSDPETEAKNTKVWCETLATEIIKEFIVTQDQDHEGFKKLLSAAKSPSPDK